MVGAVPSKLLALDKPVRVAVQGQYQEHEAGEMALLEVIDDNN